MTTAPRRIQRRRTKGWRMPANTIYVGRGSRWGNPFRVGADMPGIKGKPMDAEDAAHMFELFCGPNLAIGEELRGKNLACWCALNAPCHADVLLKWANAVESPQSQA